MVAVVVAVVDAVVDIAVVIAAVVVDVVTILVMFLHGARISRPFGGELFVCRNKEKRFY